MRVKYQLFNQIYIYTNQQLQSNKGNPLRTR